MLPVPERTNKCKRCNLRYSKDAQECTHCDYLTENEVKQLKEAHREQLKEINGIGVKLFLCAAAILLIMLFIG